MQPAILHVAPSRGTTRLQDARTNWCTSEQRTIPSTISAFEAEALGGEQAQGGREEARAQEEWLLRPGQKLEFKRSSVSTNRSECAKESSQGRRKGSAREEDILARRGIERYHEGQISYGEVLLQQGHQCWKSAGYGSQSAYGGECKQS